MLVALLAWSPKVSSPTPSPYFLEQGKDAHSFPSSAFRGLPFMLQVNPSSIMIARPTRGVASFTWTGRKEAKKGMENRKQ